VSLFFGRTFPVRLDYPVISTPQAALLADFNGDGRDDLAVAHATGVSVYLSTSTGFAPAVRYDAGADPHHVASVDVDGDGFRDLVVANSGGNSVSLLRGHGDGTFSPSGGQLLAGVSPNWVTSGDVNTDGAPDLVVSNGLSGRISVLMGIPCPVLGVDPVRPRPATQLTVLESQPNPFQVSLKIRFVLPEAGPVNAEVLDLAGRRVATLLDGGELTAGEHTLNWMPAGARVHAGLYLVRIRARDQSAIARAFRLE
jgi:hypothetical protein